MTHFVLRLRPLGWIVVAGVVATSCTVQSPLQRLTGQLSAYPEYSILLQDMREEGNFFPEYAHRYKLVWGMPSTTDPKELDFQSEVTDWERVNKKEYAKYRDYLGMVVASKTPEAGVAQSQFPPGYQYVGDSRYGTWKQDGRGGSFWEFYGKYALLSHLFGMGRRAIYRSDWDHYRGSRSAGRPYWGPNREFGTAGSYTRNSNPTFFQRRLQREQARKARFSDRVQRKARRSRMSGFRRRSSGFGK